MVVSHWLDSVRRVVLRSRVGDLLRRTSSVRRRSSGRGLDCSRTASQHVERLEERALLTPTVSLGTNDATASETGPESGEFYISRDTMIGDLTVSYSIGGSALNGTDYQSVSGSVSFSDGSKYATIAITPIQDLNDNEGSETVVLTLSSSKDYDIDKTSNSGTVTITDGSGPAPTVSITAGDPNASEVGPDNGAFTITRSGSTTAALTISYSVSGSATSKTDYSELSGSVTIAAGSSSATVTVTPVQDTLNSEGSETVVLSLSSSKDYDVDSKSTSGTVTIADDTSAGGGGGGGDGKGGDGGSGGGNVTVSISASDANASEVGPDNGAFTITLATIPSSDVTVSYSVSGTASSADYSALSGAVLIPSGSKSATITLIPVQDTASEESETVILTISSSKDYDVDTKSNSATVTIANDNSADVTVSITASDANASEVGPDTGAFTVSRTGSTTAALTVSLSLGGSASSKSDYAELPASVTIPAGSASATITVTPVQDTDGLEGAETVVLSVSKGDYSVDSNSSSATVTIADAGPVVVSITASDPDASESGPSSGAFTITRTGPTTNGLTVSITPSGSATSKTDYAEILGSVTIPAGASSATVTVSPVLDGVVESAETVILSITSSKESGYTADSQHSSATVTIADGGPVTVTSPGNQTNVEHDSVSLGITATGPTGSALTYTASGLPSGMTINSSTGLISGTVNYGATAAGPYSVQVTATNQQGLTDSKTFTWTVNALPPVVTSPGNQTSNEHATINVAVSATDPGGYTLTYSASGLPSGLTINSTTGVISGTIDYGERAHGPFSTQVTATDAYGSTNKTFAWTVNALPPIVAAIPNQTDCEGDDVTIAVSAIDLGGYTLNYSATGLPSGLSIDSSTGAISGNIAAGEAANGPYSVQVTAADAYGSANQSFTWTVNYTVPSITVAATDASAAEYDPTTGQSDSATLTFSRSGGNLSASLSVNYSIGGSSTNGTDYAMLSGSVTFAAGQNTANITIDPVDDTIPEGPETLVLALTSGTGYAIGSSSQASVTIYDSPASLTIQSLSAAGTIVAGAMRVVITGTFADTIPNEMIDLEIDWGDGVTTTTQLNSSDGTITAQHDYIPSSLEPESYDISVKISSSSGGPANGPREASTTAAGDTVSGSFWAALIAGKYTEALALLQTATSSGYAIAANKSGVTAVAGLISHIVAKFPASAQQCPTVASKISEVFRAAGQNPTTITITDAYKARFFFLADGITPFASDFKHVATLVNGRVYDALTGPAGMLVVDYRAMLVGLNLSPVITP